MLPNGQVVNLTQGGVKGFDIAQAIMGKGPTGNVGQTGAAAQIGELVEGGKTLADGAQLLTGGGGGDLPPAAPAQIRQNSPQVATTEGVPTVEEVPRDGEALQRLLAAILSRGA